MSTDFIPVRYQCVECGTVMPEGEEGTKKWYYQNGTWGHWCELERKSIRHAGAQRLRKCRPVILVEEVKEATKAKRGRPKKKVEEPVVETPSLVEAEPVETPTEEL